MFPHPNAPSPPTARFPRARGDVPNQPFAPSNHAKFSPRTRGCSALTQQTAQLYGVFPAHAGMFPGHSTKRPQHTSFPRARGDVPSAPTSLALLEQFSPRARGCSDQIPPRAQSSCVFPACAGMFLFFVSLGVTGWCFPRVRGDVPSLYATPSSPAKFSPRARGCSQPVLAGKTRPAVFPACVGMFPARFGRKNPPCCFPRVRGDVPVVFQGFLFNTAFSPRARGCSRGLHLTVGVNSVFPACAGMFRRKSPSGEIAHHFPRARGDVPAIIAVSANGNPGELTAT